MEGRDDSRTGKPKIAALYLDLLGRRIAGITRKIFSHAMAETHYIEWCSRVVGPQI